MQFSALESPFQLPVNHVTKSDQQRWIFLQATIITTTSSTRSQQETSEISREKSKYAILHHFLSRGKSEPVGNLEYNNIDSAYKDTKQVQTLLDQKVTLYLYFSLFFFLLLR